METTQKNRKSNPSLKDAHILANKRGFKLRHARAVDRINHPNTKFFVEVKPSCTVAFPNLKETKAFLANPDRWGRRGRDKTEEQA